MTAAARLGRLLPVAALAVVPGGCGVLDAPVIVVQGAYFSYWALCFGIGVVAAIIARVLLIRAGVDDALPFRAIVYCSVGLIAALAAAATI